MTVKRLLLSTFVFLLPSLLHADEKILSFHSDVTVREDGTMDVRETIVAQTEGNRIKHGIYRDFPTEYRDKHGIRKTVGFHVLEVLRDGKPDGSHEEDRDNGVRLYIGEKDVVLDPGVTTYTITYKTDRQLGFFDDHDELYWNVTGNGWEFPIDQVEAVVTLPRGIGRSDITTDGYTGPQGSKAKDFRAVVDSSGRVRFATTSPLGVEEGLTLVVGWPKGFVREPTREERRGSFIQDNLGVLVGLAGLVLILLFYLAVWFQVGRDPAAGTIIPLFEAPDRLSPAAVRFIRKMSYDDKSFAAALIDMAVKKHIRIEDKNGYTIHRLDGQNEPLTPDELKTLNALLDGKKSIDLKQANHAAIHEAIQSLKTSLKLAYEKSYFLTNSRYFVSGLLLTVVILIVSILTLPGAAKVGAIFMAIWLSGWSVGVFFLLSQVKDRWGEFFSARGVLARGANLFGALFTSAFALPFVGGEVFGIIMFVQQASLWMGGVVLGAVFLNLLFHHLLKAPTLAGRKVLDKIEGLKMYLSVAEKDRLNALAPPKKTPEVFEKFLPYALALDVEQEWSEQFAEVLAASAARGEQTYSPSWYVGTSTFTAAAFASSIGSSLSGAISSSSTTPGSSSGGGGGGSSGGGGGGGGGGGW